MGHGPGRAVGLVVVLWQLLVDRWRTVLYRTAHGGFAYEVRYVLPGRGSGEATSGTLKNSK